MKMPLHPGSLPAVLLLLVTLPLQCQTVTHDLQFWRDISKNSYAVPQGASADALADELGGVLGSPNPELRDDLAYSILAHWIYYGKLSHDEMNRLTDAWRGNLKQRIGESGNESVLLRSFSALCLSEMAGREIKDPFFGAERYRALLADTLAYLNAERDLRGYDEKLGWIHSTAHTADLLRELAVHPSFGKADQASLLDAISERLASAKLIYTHGEQERLALAVKAIVERGDFDADSFEAWLRRMEERDRAMWSHSPIPLADMARYQNDSYMLQALAAHLSLAQAGAGSGKAAAPSAAWQRAQELVLKAIKER